MRWYSAYSFEVTGLQYTKFYSHYCKYCSDRTYFRQTPPTVYGYSTPNFGSHLYSLKTVQI